MDENFVQTLVLWYMNDRNSYRERRRKIISLITRKKRTRRIKLGLLATAVELINVSNCILERPPRRRSCRRLVRNTGWYKLAMTWDDERFKDAFRITKNTFAYILSRIGDQLQRDYINEDPISADERLSICLYKLGRGDYNYTISELCGVGESSVSTIVVEVCQVIVKELWSEWVDQLFPKTCHQFSEKMIEMEEEWQYPYAFAAIDGTHIPIKCPGGGNEARKQYRNFKEFYSIVQLLLVDAHYQIIWSACGAAGNTHDSTYFQSTRLYQNICEGNVIPASVKKINDKLVPPVILGDGAYPLRTWLHKPYGDAVLTPKQRYFNYRLSRGRMITEGAIGKIKGRFRILHRRNESNKDNVRIFALASSVLHNICIKRGDIITRSMDLTVDHATNKRRSRDEINNILHLTISEPNLKDTNNSKLANEIRDMIHEEFWNEKQLTGN